jgi:hypothetical protein
MSFTGTQELAVLDHASRILAEAKSLDEIKTIRDRAEAARTYVKAARLGLELQNRAAEVKLRAERKAGKLLASLGLRGGDRRSKRRHAALKLEELGISRDQSRRWQRVAAVPENEFKQFLESANLLGQEVTSAALLRIGRKAGGLHPCQEPNPLKRNGSMNTFEPGQSSSGELVTELANHCRLLTDVLRPVYQGCEGEFLRGERRIVGHLLTEMAQLIEQLKKESARAAARIEGLLPVHILQRSCACSSLHRVS